MLLKETVRTAVLSSLCVIFLWIASILPTGRLVLLTLSTLTTMFCIMTCGTKKAGVGYLCTGLLCLFLLPKSWYGLFYIFFFGSYPFIKLFTEHYRSRSAEYGLKMLYALFLVVCAYFAIQKFMPYLPVKLWYYIIGFVAFFLFDLVCTQLLFFLHKLRHRMKL